MQGGKRGLGASELPTMPRHPKLEAYVSSFGPFGFVDGGVVPVTDMDRPLCRHYPHLTPCVKVWLPPQTQTTCCRPAAERWASPRMGCLWELLITGLVVLLEIGGAFTREYLDVQSTQNSGLYLYSHIQGLKAIMGCLRGGPCTSKGL